MPRYAYGRRPHTLVQVDTVPAGDGHRPQHVGVPKPGGVDDHIDVVGGTVGGDDAVGRDPLDGGAHQVDVVAAQRAQPGAVVLQRPFPGGRIVRQHLGQQILFSVNLIGDPVGEHHARSGVDFADRVVLVGVGRVDPRRVEPFVGAGPKHQESVPAAVIRQVVHRPAHAVADRLVVHRVGKHPLGGALKNGEVLDVVGNGGRDLKAAGAGADQRDSLTGQIDRVVPLCGMKRRPAEGLARPRIPVYAAGLADRPR